MWFVKRGSIQMVAANKPDGTVHLVEYRKPDEKTGKLSEIQEKEIDAILKECGSGWERNGENQWKDESGLRKGLYVGRRLFVSISKGNPASLAPFRMEAPRDVSLRKAGESSKELKDAYYEVERKLGNDKMQEVGPDGMAAAMNTLKSKDNPKGEFITEEDFLKRLKNGEKFTVEQQVMTDCFSCNSDPACELCRGKGQSLMRQMVTYLW